MVSNVSVYKTDVSHPSSARKIAHSIRRHPAVRDVSFDLDDCDRVLRIEHKTDEIDEQTIQTILQQFGHRMEVLP